MIVNILHTVYHKQCVKLAGFTTDQQYIFSYYISYIFFFTNKISKLNMFVNIQYIVHIKYRSIRDGGV